VDNFTERNPGIHVVTSIAVDHMGLTSEEMSAIYRIVRTMLLNVERHAEASTVVVEASSKPDSLHISIRDNGRGFSPHDRGEVDHTGNGLLLSRAYAQAVGGEFSIDSSPGQGTSVQFSLSRKKSFRWFGGNRRRNTNKMPP
jgi:signal transduction histidine kinase